MTDKFKEVPIEKDTKIIFRNEMKFGKHDVLYEMWIWDGSTAESVIFASKDVIELTDDELEEEFRLSPLLKDKDSEITINRAKSGFTFINFNFESD